MDNKCKIIIAICLAHSTVCLQQLSEHPKVNQCTISISNVFKTGLGKCVPLFGCHYTANARASANTGCAATAEKVDAIPSHSLAAVRVRAVLTKRKAQKSSLPTTTALQLSLFFRVACFTILFLLNFLSLEGAQWNASFNRCWASPGGQLSWPVLSGFKPRWRRRRFPSARSVVHAGSGTTNWQARRRRGTTPAETGGRTLGRAKSLAGDSGGSEPASEPASQRASFVCFPRLSPASVLLTSGGGGRGRGRGRKRRAKTWQQQQQHLHLKSGSDWSNR